MVSIYVVPIILILYGNDGGLWDVRMQGGWRKENSVANVLRPPPEYVSDSGQPNIEFLEVYFSYYSSCTSVVGLLVGWLVGLPIGALLKFF